MLDVVEVFTCCGLPQGKGLGIVTQSGGAGVLIADRAEELGLKVPLLHATTRQALQQVLPAFGAAANPVDVTGQFIANPALLKDSVRLVLSDPEVHAGIVWLQLMDAYVDVLIDIFKEIRDQASKPFVVCWVAAPDRALQALRAAGIAVLRGAEPAVEAVAALMEYAAARRHWLADKSAAGAVPPLPEAALPATAGVLASDIAQQLLHRFGVATARTEFAASAEAAVAAAHRLGYPVALKIESPDILHKTEARGVRLGLGDDAAVRAAFETVMAGARRYRPGARCHGVVVQAMARGDVELVIGLKNDAAFGAVVMVGLGGIHIEVLKDVVFRQAPVTPAQAGRMLEALAGRSLLDGWRGRPPVNRRLLQQMISAVSQLGAVAGARLRELDLNPVFAGADTVVAVDWLIVLD
ncbi:MAG: acetate--CoA ligase family protein [Burkholderiales bacterium]